MGLRAGMAAVLGRGAEIFSGVGGRGCEGFLGWVYDIIPAEAALAAHRDLAGKMLPMCGFGLRQ